MIFDPKHDPPKKTHPKAKKSDPTQNKPGLTRTTGARGQPDPTLGMGRVRAIPNNPQPNLDPTRRLKGLIGSIVYMHWK